jgi:serine/threonine protein kinase
VNDDPHVEGQGLTSLAPGDRLGPYEVVGLIGSGGMGEVYRAHDPRLGRPVALKILRGSPHDAEHVARFAREARAAGSLNHPNIVAVFDVAREAGIPYVVTELLEGETLRTRLKRGALPYRKAIDYGIQIAQALDAAHGKGIWHRDVKPANIFLTDDGRVKLLDFGIAKLSERETTADARDTTVESTQAGEVRGTAGYMSPEQVLGEPVDHRSDIFALGSILYEMFTGTRAFQRPSNIETMNAVLQEDPPELLTVNPKLPAAAAAIVERCLEKNKEERFQSARDLAFDLQQLREQTSSSRTLAAPQPSLRRMVLPVLLALAVAAAIVMGTILALQPPPPPPPTPPTFDQLTFRRGRIGGARFTPDGQAVIYSEALQGNLLQVSRLFLTDRTARALDFQSGTDLLAVRRNGELVLSTGRRFIVGERFVGHLAVAEAGGAPRQVGENIEDADAHPVTGELAVVHSSGDMSGQSQIEYPIGTPIYTTDGSIRFLRFSRDGRQLAFVEDPQARGVNGRLGVIAASVGSTPTYLRNERESVRGLAWSPTGHEIWFTAGPRNNRALRAIALDKTERLIYAAPGSLTLWDIAQDGRVLLTRDEERRTVMGVGPGEQTERDLSLFDNAGIADISDDGQSILMGDRHGLYMRPTTGAPPTSQGISGFGDDISGDGSMILATDSSGHLVILRKGAVKPEPLQPFGITSYSGARFFATGQKVVLVGKKDRFLRSYVQDLVGGAPVPITPERTWGIAISPDDAWVAATGPDRLISLWPTSGSGPSRPVKGSEPDDRPVAWSHDQKSLWTFRRGEIPAQVFQIDLTTGRRRPWKTLVPPDTAGVYSVIELRVTPTGSAYGYSYTRLLSQLYLTRGLQ